MRIFSKITGTEIEAIPVVDGQCGRLLGFQEKVGGPIMPVDLFSIPFAFDWVAVRHQALMAVLPGVAARLTSLVQSNSKYQQVEYPTEQAIVEEATRIADTVVRMLQEQEDTFFSAGAEAIRKERSRQVMSEGYDMKHDERHEPEKFIQAAVAYLLSAVGNDEAAGEWPFDAEFFKPKDKIRDMERAGALIAAGLDLMYRKVEEKNIKTNKK